MRSLKEQAERALKFFREELTEQAPDPNISPRAFLICGNNKVTYVDIDVRFMKHWQDKNKLTMMLVRQMFDLMARDLIILSDTWFGRVNSAEERRRLPASLGDWPKHLVQDALLCTVNRMGEVGETYTQPYKREGNIIVFDEIIKPGDIAGKGGASLGGRFELDLTKRDFKEAAKQIAMYGRGPRRPEDFGSAVN